jgi:hypothetical protein
MQTLTNKLIDAYGAILRADAQELLDAAKTIYKLKEWDAVADCCMRAILQEAHERIQFGVPTPLTPLLQDVVAIADEFFGEI